MSEILNAQSIDLEEIRSLLVEFFRILDTTEESDSGTLFNPTVISSCRVRDCEKLNEILIKLKEYSF